MHAVIAHIGGFEGNLAREGMLNAKGPVLDIRGSEIAIHGEGVARIGPAAYEQACDIRGIDRRRLILPSQAGSGDKNSSGGNVSDSGATRGRGSGACSVLNRRAGRNDTRPKESDGTLQILLRHECAHGEQVVNNAAAGPDDSGALAGYVPSDTKAW